VTAEGSSDEGEVKLQPSQLAQMNALVVRPREIAPKKHDFRVEQFG
jgi:hypothetical protein